MSLFKRKELIITPSATPTFSSLPEPSSTPPPPARIYIKVRDFGFHPSDERHLGLGADIPKANRVHRLNRKLGGPDRATARDAAALDPSSSSASSASGMGNGTSRRTDSIGSVGSVDSSDADAEEEEEEEDGGVEGWGISMTTTMNGIFPSRKDLDMNFMDSPSSDDEDDGQLGRCVADQEGEPLYPGLYRALYAFEPEGMAEMGLDENQIVRVVGRGGGIGWAVVVDERGVEDEEEGGRGKVQVKHALVPESYLEAVSLDWEEEEEEGMDVAENKDEDGDGDGDGAAVVKAGDA